MKDSSICPSCGATLAPGRGGEMCPACLLRAAMGEDGSNKPAAPAAAGVGDEHGFPSIAERLGVRIGRYKLLEQIGEGGFGVVWMAEQDEPVRRRVALKIIKPGMDTREVVARFEAERQALAMMEHPNIASVFDGGATETGRPYFVMELVKGVPITTYCDTRQLSTRERLELFMEVCQAVQHAHQKGVIHRDLKPSNILVTVKDDRAVPKVIDFGVAKATQARLTEKTLFTRLNQWIGTPEYMSPEQAGLGRLDVDTRSDIYSLGVLLYELLTGRPPFDPEKLRAAGYDAVMRTIREEEPPKPSTRLGTLAEDEMNAVAAMRRSEPAKLNRLLRGDLDWIVMKALEKDRQRRYETPSSLAADLQRHLDYEPVLARPPGTFYLIQKAWRRNKVLFTAGAVVAVALTLGIAVSTWQAVRATRAEAMAMQRLDESEAISHFLTSAFQSPDPARDGRTITIAERLDTAVQKLDTGLAGQPARRASLQATIGATYRALGLPRDAIPLLEKARDYQRANAGPEHPDTLQALANLADAYYDAGRWDEALELREQVLRLLRKTLGPEHPATLKAMAVLATSYSAAGRHEEALKLREDVLPLSRKVNGPDHRDTLYAMQSLAISRGIAGHWIVAVQLMEEVIELMGKTLGPDHPDTLKAMDSLGWLYFEAGLCNEALKLRENLLERCRKVLGPEHPGTFRAMANLSMSYAAAGRNYDEELKLRTDAVRLSRKVLGREHPDTLWLTLLLVNDTRRPEAIKMIEEVLSICRRVLRPGHPLTLDAMCTLAGYYADAGRRDEARQLLEEMLPLYRKNYHPDPPDPLQARNNASLSSFYGGNLNEAIEVLQETLPLYRELFGPDHPNTLKVMTNLTMALVDAGRRDEALELREDLLERCRKVYRPGHPDTLAAIQALAESYTAARRTAEALALRRELAELQAKAGNNNTPTRK